MMTAFETFQFQFFGFQARTVKATVRAVIGESNQGRHVVAVCRLETFLVGKVGI